MRHAVYMYTPKTNMEPLRKKGFGSNEFCCFEILQTVQVLPLKKSNP